MKISACVELYPKERILFKFSNAFVELDLCYSASFLSWTTKHGSHVIMNLFHILFMSRESSIS